MLVPTATFAGSTELATSRWPSVIRTRRARASVARKQLDRVSEVHDSIIDGERPSGSRVDDDRE